MNEANECLQNTKVRTGRRLVSWHRNPINLVQKAIPSNSRYTIDKRVKELQR